MRPGTALCLSLLPFFPTLLATSTARADVIDGSWCYPDGRHFSIHGPAIVTTFGHSLQGDYSRHHFAYVIPKPEPQAGELVTMQLMNDTIYLSVGSGQAGQDQPTEVWHRCPPEISGEVLRSFLG
jgi:hypothetical protein